MRRFLQRLQALQRDAVTLWFALKHPDTPWYARAFAGVLVAYALSPIDLIPDFIPVLGLLDDLVIIPAGVWLVMRLLPAHVVADSRSRALQWYESKKSKPCSQAGLLIILALWSLAAWLIYRAFTG